MVEPAESIDGWLRLRRPDDPVARGWALAQTESLLFGHDHRPLRFGRYILLEKLGAGGQGVVHAAYDPELDRRVAVKLLFAPAHDDAALSHALLLREAQAAAALSHPNVLAVYDVGSFDRGDAVGRDAGGVYMVTELVDGETLQAWLAAGSHRTSETLAVLRAAGLGLAAAHARGLVHRDFKPANVLIGRDGRVRVVDFGLARLAPAGPSTEGSESRPRIESTRSTARRMCGTPAYMAPEQHNAVDDVDARADVFAYCVTLFEALFGARPFVGRDVAELRAAKKRNDIRVPKGVRVPSWLEATARRGLDPDPDKRWPNMAALLAALERDPARRWRVFAIAGVGAAVVGGVAATAIHEHRARASACSGSERELAGVWDEQLRASGSAAFVAADPDEGVAAWQRVERGLDGYANRWVELRDESCRATVIDEGEPMSVMSRRMLCLDRRAAQLGGLVRRLGEVDRHAVGQAAASVAQLPPLDPCMAAESSELVPDAAPREEVLAIEAEIADAEALRLGDRFAEAEAASDRAVARATALGDAGTLARVWLHRGGLERWRGDFAAAEVALRHALHEAEAASDHETDITALVELASVVGVPLGRPDEALHLVDHAAAKLARGPGGDHLAAQLAFHRARVLSRMGRHAEAELELRTALELAERMYGSEHPFVADIVNMLGVELEQIGRRRDALAHYERAYETRVALGGETNARAAVALANVAFARWNLGECTAALAQHEHALGILDRTLGPDHPDSAWARRVLAMRLIELERPTEALEVAETVLASEEKRRGHDPRYLVHSLLITAGAQRELGRPALALVHVDRALAILRDGNDDTALAAAWVDRAATLRELDRCDDAALALAEAVRVPGSGGERSSDSPHASAVRAERGRCALARGDAADAVRDLRAAMADASATDPLASLWLRMDLWRALVQTSSPDAKPLAGALIDELARTGLRPSWRAELEAGQ
jgi:tetratricopeptide (TPR) repeat protein